MQHSNVIEDPLYVAIIDVTIPFGKRYAVFQAARLEGRKAVSPTRAALQSKSVFCVPRHLCIYEGNTKRNVPNFIPAETIPALSWHA